MYSKKPVETTDSKKKPIKRFYYLHIPTSLDTLTDRIEAVISIPEDKRIMENIGRDVKLDLSTRELEYHAIITATRLMKSGIDSMKPLLPP